MAASTHQKPNNLSLEEWQISLRHTAATKAWFTITPQDAIMSPGDFSVSNRIANSRYKVVYRGDSNPWNYCSCLDFKTSQLGTCKHLEAVKIWLAEHPDQNTYLAHPESLEPPYTSVYLSYKGERKVRIRFGTLVENELKGLASTYFDAEGALRPECLYTISNFLQEAAQLSPSFRCYPDALNFILEHREFKQREKQAEHILDHGDLEHLVRVPLYPYQKEGILFAFRAGRSILADEMGLGKTIQAIGTAELLKRQRLAGSVLILCPTSLKYQWKHEIERFTGREAILIEGNPIQRKEAYQTDAFYKILSYNTLSNDIKTLPVQADFLIMDEAQRLKNWHTQIAQAARKARSTYTLILSGTPLQNKLDELYSIVQFVDQYRLGPYYKFVHETTQTNESGQITGYKHLHLIAEKLRPILLRRRRNEVAIQLPARTDKLLLVPMTEQQRIIHDEQQSIVAGLVHKWQQLRFLSEKDRNRLLMALSQMRMVCDSTYILDQETRHDTKVAELLNILTSVYESGDEKVVVFSQWERMTRIVGQELDRIGIAYAHLNGSIPSTKRNALIERFVNDPECRVFLSTDTGSTGLNLQCASILINLDLPWNPAILEQRISRIYRIGQDTNVQIITFVAQHTLEERMRSTLLFKSSLFEGVLDGGSDQVFMESSKFEALMERISQLTPTPPETEKAPQTEPLQGNLFSALFEEDTESERPKSTSLKKTTPIKELNSNPPSTSDEALLQQGIELITQLSAKLSTQERKQLSDFFLTLAQLIKK
ncbi:MAG: DEAD/DEAH box helicase [Bacteroidaceae bacterium]